MILTLEIIASPSGLSATGSRKVFGAAGGVIGRVGGLPGDRRDTWILPHTKVSKEHARISWVNGAFHVEDTSRNGVGLNSPKNRLPKGRPHALKSGDRLFIDPYEISVSVRSESQELYEDVHRPVAMPSFSRDELALEEELDPLNLLEPRPASPPRRKVPTAEDLNAAAPWTGHYEPPAVVQPPAPKPRARASSAPVMPEGYNPLAPEESDPDPGPEEFESLFPPPADRQTDPFAPAPPAEIARPAIPNALAPPPSAFVPAPAEHRGGSDLAAVLAGAGLEGVAVTPELARSFGEILHVVVAGVMDVLQARHQIKDEFRMRMTHLRVADNNPLKFSADVNDALHNLLVKRNQAYLSPVQAFEDAFEDLRHHQIAMLAGMRVAFEFMLAEFAPDRLEEEFGRQIEKGALIGTAGLRHLRSWRYWELYRDKQLEIAKDPETSFRKLFGEAFAKAYEEQLERLRAQR